MNTLVRAELMAAIEIGYTVISEGQALCAKEESIRS